MSQENLILHLPFDEPNRSNIAYDYSNNRNDGIINDATFVTGKNGKAIKFVNSNDTCTVSNQLPLIGDFSMLMWFMPEQQNTVFEAYFYWGNSHGGVLFNANGGVWNSFALVRNADRYKLYINGEIVREGRADGVLLRMLIEDRQYASPFVGLVDDFKIFNVALSQYELIQEFADKQIQEYLLNDVNFKEYGVYVSASKGVVDKPKLKALEAHSWDNYHGTSIDLQHKYYENREITLDCFVKASSKYEFIEKVTQFEEQFQKKGTQRLSIFVYYLKPLIYEVYCSDEIAISKRWRDDIMAGTFSLKLIEPEPIKRVLKHIKSSEETKTCVITITTEKLVNIYWGDGSVDFDISGNNITITHDYENDGDYFPVITGCIDEIIDFETNAIIVWHKI